MIDDLRNKRSLFYERIMVALGTNNAQLAHGLLVQFNEVHWRIVAIEDSFYHVEDIKHELAMSEAG